MKKYLLSCDWGTTSFRLRLIERADSTLAGEVLSQNGIGQTYNLWQSRENDGLSREEFFRQQLQEHIDALARQVGFSMDGVTIVMSGMASSSIGMQEIPYANLPFALDGSGALMQHFGVQPDFPHEIMLVSGVRSDHDVMRGEETQLIGLVETAGLPENGDAIFIFPGTHSKHMYVRNNQLIDFKTYMTGEVFNLMTRHSILRDSIELNGSEEFSAEKVEAYKAGVREAGVANILNALFTVRTNQLFSLWDKQQNGMFLSGLLIGHEIQYLLQEKDWQLVLCSGNNLYELYRMAIEELQLSDRTVTIPAGMVDKSAVAGHVKIFSYQKSTLNKLNL